MGSQFGGNLDERCNSVTVDSNDYVYCGGYSSGGFADLVNTTNATGSTAMVIKAHTDGQFAWGRRIGNVGNLHPNSNSTCLDITVDNFNNIYCGGNISTSTTITQLNSNPEEYEWKKFLKKLFNVDGDSPQLFSLASASALPPQNYDALIFKMDSDGNLLFRKEIDSSNGRETIYDLHFYTENILLGVGFKDYYLDGSYTNKDISVIGMGTPLNLPLYTESDQIEVDSNNNWYFFKDNSLKKFDSCGTLISDTYQSCSSIDVDLNDNFYCIKPNRIKKYDSSNKLVFDGYTSLPLTTPSTQVALATKELLP